MAVSAMFTSACLTTPIYVFTRDKNMDVNTHHLLASGSVALSADGVKSTSLCKRSPLRFCHTQLNDSFNLMREFASL